jgi:hypothetical protein
MEVLMFRHILLIFFAVCLTGLAARAEVKTASKIEPACQTAAAQISILRWKARPYCSGDCFLTRYSCAGGKYVDVASALHPTTTALQLSFYHAAPWSILLGLLPFLIVAGVSTVASAVAVPLLALNVLFLSYLTTTLVLLYASITGNPFGEWVWLERLAFLNPYAFGAASILFVIVNLPPVWRAMEDAFFRQGSASFIAPPIVADANTLLRFGSIDPRESTLFFRRETDRLRAAKDRLDAETAFTHAFLRRARSQHDFNQYP